MMFFRRNLLLCLVALFTSIVAALPITPSLSTLHDLASSQTPAGTATLVSRQEDNPQRALFCHYNPLDCQKQFPQYCTDMTKPSPDWCDVIPTGVAQLDAEFINLPTDDHSLVSRQESPEDIEKEKQDAEKKQKEIEKKQREFCYKNPGYCESICEGDDGFCDDITCRNDPARCRKLFSERRCTAWEKGNPWWCNPDNAPPALTEITNLVEREATDHNEARDLYCRYNPSYCRKVFASRCVGNKEDIPSWCDAEATPSDLAEEKTYVDVEPLRDLYCKYNPSYCRKVFASHCIGNKEYIPSWCNAEATLLAPEDEITNVAKRSPQDDPEKEDPEEQEEPHPIERSWCKKHPNHPYCYSQFCRDHPGYCKVVVDGSAAIPPPPPPAADGDNGDNAKSLYKRGSW
ncbi:hypothetical protein QM012_004259 [Aureobasidium pullulans]|uniref:Uncharacterized protein n=1 Tax=Aureobasidium pullulans TaxID=5580 RepID=A0ABR0TUC8_AURPU